MTGDSLLSVNAIVLLLLLLIEEGDPITIFFFNIMQHARQIVGSSSAFDDHESKRSNVYEIYSPRAHDKTQTK